MKAWPESRPEVLKMLEQLCNSCKAARDDIGRMSKQWTRLRRNALGPTYAPVQAILIRFANLVDELSELEAAAIKAVQGEVYTEEEEDARYDALYEAMRLHLSERERQVFAALYMTDSKTRRVARVDSGNSWDYEAMSEEERGWHGDSPWVEKFYDVPHKPTQQEVAESLGISQSAVSKLAKSAEAKMIREVGWWE
jgi:RNA polymerase sigma factor (sigma-70 family)